MLAEETHGAQGSQDSPPLVSVVVASYEMGGYVCQAVDSVLAQDYPRLEVIVVNDGSTDDTRERLARYDSDSRVTVVHQQNRGQTVAKNVGLSRARGELVGFCDADNLWRPGKLSRQVPLLLDNPRVGVVYGDINLIDGDGKPLPPMRTRRYGGRITAKLLIDNFVTFNTTLVPRKLLEEIGGFDEDLRMAIDYNLWLQISLTHEFLYIDEPLVDYRIWGGQMSHRTGERMDNFFRLLEKFLADHPDAVTAAEARRAWAHSYTTRGIWLDKMGRKGEAWGDYRRALRKRPHDLRLWRSIARLVLGVEDRKRKSRTDGP
jgi:glycosyltransferase involved in cell wall biosynthesis